MSSNDENDWEGNPDTSSEENMSSEDSWSESDSENVPPTSVAGPSNNVPEKSYQDVDEAPGCVILPFRPDNPPGLRLPEDRTKGDGAKYSSPGQLYSLLPFEEQDSQPAVGRQRSEHSTLGKLLLRGATPTGRQRDSPRFQGAPCSRCWAILQDLIRPQQTLRPERTYDFAAIEKKAMLNNGW